MPAVQKSRSTEPPRATWLFAVLLIGVIGVAYSTGLNGAFIFDDLYAIVENPTIRSLAEIEQVLFVPAAEAGTVGGRPLVNLTLALNFAISGTEPWSYHVLNVVIHALAALTLFGIVRRTLGGISDMGVMPKDAGLVAMIVAALWALHPLQTESVTYVVQRAEALGALAILLTLYCYVRSMDAARPVRWQIAAVVACLLGAGCKEIVVAAPLIVLMYDRAFVARSWHEVWLRRWPMHAGLLATWVPLAALVLATQGRGGSAGFGTAIAVWDYALTQSVAIPHYLQLVLWPNSLVFDYGTSVIRDPGRVLPGMLVLVVLLAATGWAAVRRPALGFLGLSFFAVLAPSSSFVPVATQTMAEHRMYLPLAVVVILLVLAAYRFGGRRTMLALSAIGVAAGVATAARNRVYRSELSIWSDTVARRPDNARAWTNLGIALTEAGRAAEAVAAYETALKIEPGNASTHLNLGAALTQLGRVPEAISHGEAAVIAEPKSADARLNLGYALVQGGRADEAVPHLEAALQLQPAATDVQLALADALATLGRAERAIGHYEAVLRRHPDHVQAWCGVASVRARAGDVIGARKALNVALAAAPNSTPALYLLGNIEIAEKRLPEAISAFQRAVAAAPDHIPARNNLANSLLMNRQFDEAVQQYREILKVRPDDTRVRENLEYALQLQRAAARR